VEEVERLAADIREIAAALGGNSVAGDTGERARNNVRRAIRVVTAESENGGPDERSFAEHLQKQLSTGHECQYLQSEGRIWKQGTVQGLVSLTDQIGQPDFPP
jgi:hypothetical protein